MDVVILPKMTMFLPFFPIIANSVGFFPEKIVECKYLSVTFCKSEQKCFSSNRKEL